MNRLFLRQYNNLLKSLKKYSTDCIYKDEFTVSPFCNLFVNATFNVKIRPLDVHLFPNCDKLILHVYSNTLRTKPYISCTKDNNNFHINGESNDTGNISCLIETPVKSDLNIQTTGLANIDIRKINGDTIILQTESGDIKSESCQTSKISYSSSGGSITSLGTLHAADIQLQTEKSGSIQVNHLQALRANVKTENGDISVKSSYCDETHIATICGDLTLDNLHKNCSITISEKGVLKMTGFDGTLTAHIKEGAIDIQASKLYDVSKIKVMNKSSVLLRLSEWIQENTAIKTTCQLLKVDDNVKLVIKNNGTCALLVPKNSENNKSEFIIEANLSNICVEEASWSDMLKLKGINFSE